MLGNRDCLQVETNARSALIGLYYRDVGQIGTAVGSHLTPGLHWQSFSAEICIDEFQVLKDL
jgi:hypothetical protein